MAVTIVQKWWRKWRFQYSLRSLMIFITVVAILMGIWRSTRITRYYEHTEGKNGDFYLSLQRTGEDDCFLQVVVEGMFYPSDIRGTKEVALFGTWNHEHGSFGPPHCTIDSWSSIGGVLTYNISLPRASFAIYEEGSLVEYDGKKYRIPEGQKLEIRVLRDVSTNITLFKQRKGGNVK